MAGNVVGQLRNRDKHSFEILTGKLQFYGDQLGGKRFFGAVKTSTIARGSIKMLPTGGRIGSCTVSARGSGYSTAPTVNISGGGGSGATARASVINGEVVLITLVNRGNGYTSTPTVTLTGGGGNGATANITVTASEPAIDTSEAELVPGVRAVLNYLDSRGNLTGNVHLQNTIAYWGTPVAAVVADDWYTALYACGLIKIEYEENPEWITSVWEAMKPGAPAVQTPQTGGISPNVSNPVFTVRPLGQTDTEFADELGKCTYQASHEQGFTTDYAHNMLEPHGQTSWWVGDHCYVWTGTQNLHNCHGTFTSNLGRNAAGISATVHTYTQGTGGGHGDKTGANMGGLASRMSLFVDGAPVTVYGPRCTNITSFSRQSGSAQSIKIGADSNHKILCFESTATTGGGASTGTCSFTGIQQSYIIPNYRHRQRNVYMNRPARGPWRCVGDPPGCMGYDGAIDRLAERIGISPYELRMKNLRDKNTETDGIGVPISGAQNYAPINPYCALELTTILKTVHDASGYASKWHAPGKGPDRADGRKHGIALSCHVDGHGGVSSGRYMNMVANNLNSTPYAFILGGFGRGPSGAPSAMASIVAERMGLGYDNVWVTNFGESDRTLASGNQAGSGFTSGAGGAAYNMADKARTEILTAALGNTAFSNLDVPSSRTRATAEATVSNGIVTSVTVINGGDGYTGNPRVSFTGGGGSGIAATANVVEGKVVSIGITNPGTGYTSAPSVTIGWLSIADLDPKNNYIYLADPSLGPSTTSLAITSVLGSTGGAWWGAGWGPPSGISSAGSSGACAEVLVDTETGEIEVTGIWNCVDTGGTIFKRGAIKEMLSGCELMISQTLFYGDIYDYTHNGAIIGTQWTQSQCPTAMDLPCGNYWAQDIEANDCGPYGAHGIGEPCVSNVSAINGAIFNAIGVFVDPEHGAMNPDRVLKALGKA